MVNKHNIRQAYYHIRRFEEFVYLTGRGQPTNPAAPAQWLDAHIIATRRIIPAMRAIIRQKITPTS